MTERLADTLRNGVVVQEVELGPVRPLHRTRKKRPTMRVLFDAYCPACGWHERSLDLYPLAHDARHHDCEA